MSHHIVSARDVRFAYEDGATALDGVSFTIYHGESVGLVGANGAGKSTLLLHLAGVLFAREGEVRVGDLPVTRATLREVRRSIGVVFQDADDQLFMPTVEDDVAFGPRNLGLAEAEVESRVAQALATVGIAHLRRRASHRLSGGEKRAAAIAAVLAAGPSVLVMDEPSSSLDPAARRALIAQLRGFAHTKIVASHDLDLVLDVCERTIVLRDGRVAADGPTGEVLVDDALLATARLERPLRLQGCPRCGGGASSHAP